MKKKIIIIELVDGRKILRDISKEDFKDHTGRPLLLLNAPANHPVYAGICQAICAGGYTDIEANNENRYTHIAPSQIKSVSFQFEKDGEQQ
jgi:hypothetical protein